MRRTIVAVIGSIILFSCKDKNAIPAGILKPAEMQAVLFDVLRADAFTFDFITKDTTKKPEVENVKLQQQIFAKHKIAKDDFYKSFEYYKMHPAIMQPMLDSLINKATRDKFNNTNPSKPVTDTAKVAI